MVRAQIAVERHRAADAVALQHLHEAEHADPVAVVARAPGRDVGRRRAGTAGAGRHLLHQREELDVGDHPERDLGAVRPAQPRAVDDRRIGKRTVGRGLHRIVSLPCGRCASTVEMAHDLVDMQHVDVLVVHVEQVDLVREDAAVEAAFLDQRHVEAVRIGVDRGRAHAARGALAADDQALDAKLSEMRNQRRAEEHAGALLGDDDVLRLRLEFRPDRVVGGIDRRLVALGGGDQGRPAFGAHVAGRIEDRQAGARARPRTAAWSARSPHRRIRRSCSDGSWPVPPADAARRDRPRS